MMTSVNYPKQQYMPGTVTGTPMMVSGGTPMMVSGGTPMMVPGGTPMMVSGGTPMMVSGGTPMMGNPSVSYMVPNPTGPVMVQGTAPVFFNNRRLWLQTMPMGPGQPKKIASISLMMFGGFFILAGTINMIMGNDPDFWAKFGRSYGPGFYIGMVLLIVGVCLMAGGIYLRRKAMNSANSNEPFSDTPGHVYPTNQNQENQAHLLQQPSTGQANEQNQAGKSIGFGNVSTNETQNTNSFTSNEPSPSKTAPYDSNESNPVPYSTSPYAPPNPAPYDSSSNAPAPYNPVPYNPPPSPSYNPVPYNPEPYNPPSYK